MFLGCDDLLHPDFVATVRAAHAAFPRRRDHPARRPGHRRARAGRRPAGRQGEARRSARASTAATELGGEDLAVSLLRGNWLYWPSLVFRTERVQQLRLPRRPADHPGPRPGHRHGGGRGDAGARPRPCASPTAATPRARRRRAWSTGSRLPDERRYYAEAAGQMRAARLAAGRPDGPAAVESAACTRLTLLPARLRARSGRPRAAHPRLAPARRAGVSGDRPSASRNTSSVSSATRRHENDAACAEPGRAELRHPLRLGRHHPERVGDARRVLRGSKHRTASPPTSRSTGMSEASTGSPAAIASSTGSPKPSAQGRHRHRPRPGLQVGQLVVVHPARQRHPVGARPSASTSGRSGSSPRAPVMTSRGRTSSSHERQRPDQAGPVLVRTALAAGEHEVLRRARSRRPVARVGRRPGARRAAGRSGSRGT